jgi:hypothetical protein
MDISRLVIPKGDKGFVIRFNVKDADGNPLDLLTATVKFKMWKAGTPTTLLINGACAITNPSGGICEYTVAAADFTTLGLFYGELEVTKTGVAESSEAFEVLVTESPMP